MGAVGKIAGGIGKQALGGLTKGGGINDIAKLGKMGKGKKGKKGKKAELLKMLAKMMNQAKGPGGMQQ